MHMGKHVIVFIITHRVMKGLASGIISGETNTVVAVKMLKGQWTTYTVQ